jgi:uncharacterized repeat protein (TIGR03803 family)
VLKHFTGSDGADHGAALALSGNVLYGTTLYGGNSSVGSVFQLNTDGTGYSILKRFTGSDGEYPGGLTVTDNVLYGTTVQGGDSDFGTVFKIDLAVALTPIPLVMQRLGDSLLFSWTNPAFSLQAAPALAGIYTNIAGATSPYTNAISGPQRFFRLIGN